MKIVDILDTWGGRWNALPEGVRLAATLVCVGALILVGVSRPSQAQSNQAAALSASSGQPAKVPALSGRVVDTTGTLSEAESAGIANKLKALEDFKGAQIAVLMVQTTGGEAIEQFSLRVAEQWKIGRAKIDDGALIVVAKNDRKMRIEVGYGLEGAIPDAIAKRVVEEVMKPRFKVGDYAGGISDAVDKLTGLAWGEALPAPSKLAKSKSSKSSNYPMENDGFGIVFILVVVGAWVALVVWLGAIWSSAIVALGVFYVLMHVGAGIALSLQCAGAAFVIHCLAVTFGPTSLALIDRGRSSNGLLGVMFSGDGGSFGGGGASGSW